MRSHINAVSALSLVASMTVAACSNSDAPVAPGAARPASSLERSDKADPKWSSWSIPQNLGAVINTGSIEQHPTISKDGLSLYFASDRTGTLGGLDTWVSHRASVDDPWGAPVNLGPNINSAGNDFAVAFTGEILRSVEGFVEGDAEAAL